MIDIIGKRFGKLVVESIGRIERPKYGKYKRKRVYVFCKCDCDNPDCNEKFTFASMLKSFNLTPDDVLDMLQDQDIYW